MNALVVVGTRPEAIKLAPVVRALRADGEVRVRLVVTGQHRELLDQALGFLEMRPDIDLELMREGQDLGALTARVLEGIGAVLDADGPEQRPDVVVVQGDTTSCFAASLAAFYRQIPVAHVEAGLRTGQRYRPFPEEIDRRLTTVLSTLHFAPTEAARANLLAEGIAEGDVVVTGNTAIDSLRWATTQLRAMSATQRRELEPGGLDPARRLVLVTVHRRESLQADALDGIARALNRLAAAHPQVDLVLPLHPNPAVSGPLRARLTQSPNLHLCAPLSYGAFVALLERAELVLTDSGGVQEEAPSLGTPLLVLREVTERPEILDAGVARLVGTEAERIVAEASALLDDPRRLQEMATPVDLYGDGRAAERIARALRERFGG